MREAKEKEKNARANMARVMLELGDAQVGRFLDGSGVRKVRRGQGAFHLRAVDKPKPKGKR
jgi:hypothetical protein